MKTFCIILATLICFLLLFNGCIVTVVGDVTAPVSTTPGISKIVSLALVAIYEVIVSIAPKAGDYSAVSWIIKILKKVSDTLNVRNEL